MARAIIKEIQAKTILVPSKLPDADYVINPYTGCSFGCSYCYASFMGRFVNKKIEVWGKYVYPKVNLPEILDKELSKIKEKTKSVLLSSVTDPYLGEEFKYKLTRKALELLLKHKWKGTIGILTKSTMVKRDIDLFKQFENVEVGMTVTSTDDNVSRFLEGAAPPASARIKALKELNENGVKTYAFIGPLLPHFSATPEKLKEIFDALQDSGVKELFIEHINLSHYIKKRLLSVMKDVDKEIIGKFYTAETIEYREKLNEQIRNLLKNYNFRLRQNKILYHKNKEKK